MLPSLGSRAPRPKTRRGRRESMSMAGSAISTTSTITPSESVSRADVRDRSRAPVDDFEDRAQEYYGNGTSLSPSRASARLYKCLDRDPRSDGNSRESRTRRRATTASYTASGRSAQHQPPAASLTDARSRPTQRSIYGDAQTSQQQALDGSRDANGTRTRSSADSDPVRSVLDANPRRTRRHRSRTRTALPDDYLPPTRSARSGAGNSTASQRGRAVAQSSRRLADDHQQPLRRSRSIAGQSPTYGNRSARDQRRGIEQGMSDPAMPTESQSRIQVFYEDGVIMEYIKGADSSGDRRRMDVRPARNRSRPPTQATDPTSLYGSEELW